jgi:hypothetical protein
MVKFVEVKPEDIKKVEGKARGRFTAPILQEFLESNLYMVKIDRKNDPVLSKRPLMSIYTGLGQTVRKHQMPIRVQQVDGEIFLSRIDRTPEGKEIPDWKEKLGFQPKRSSDITPDEDEAVDVDDLGKEDQ